MFVADSFLHNKLARAGDGFIRSRRRLGPARGEGTARGRRRARRRHAPEPRDRARRAPRQRRARALRRAHDRVDGRDGPTAQEAPRPPRSVAARARTRVHDVDEARPQSAAAAGAPRGCRLQRLALGAAHRGAHAEPRASARRDRRQAAPELPCSGHARHRRARPGAARPRVRGGRLGCGAERSRARRRTRSPARSRRVRAVRDRHPVGGALACRRLQGWYSEGVRGGFHVST